MGRINNKWREARLRWFGHILRKENNFGKMTYQIKEDLKESLLVQLKMISRWLDEWRRMQMTMKYGEQ